MRSKQRPRPSQPITVRTTFLSSMILAVPFCAAYDESVTYGGELKMDQDVLSYRDSQSYPRKTTSPKDDTFFAVHVCDPEINITK